jgi:hypothetical protein
VKYPILLLYFFVFFPAVFIHGNDTKEKWQIVKTTEKMNFDGICDEALWDNLEMFPMRMFRPNHEAQPTERSEIFATFDDEFFYLGARLFYENGAKIVVTTKKRDGADGGSDNFGILLDTFDDNENALCFETNPSGLRSDFSIANDAQSIIGTMPFNRDWNTFWEVKTFIFENGWHTEFRIPLSSLRFQQKDGAITMGMTIWRSMVSKQEWNVFPLISNEFGSLGVWKPSQAQKIELRNVSRTNPIFLTPYILTGIEQTSTLNEQHSAYEIKSDPKLNAGLDLKYALTSNLTLDLTLNTDFAQVEVDDQMVNISRFDIFFPEKRQFFLERNSTFTLRTGLFDQLFYSRRIGLVEGEIIPIIAGVRMVGRAGKYDLGFMDMQTLQHEYIDDDTDSLVTIAPTNHGVLRLRKQVFNQTSYAGGMVTSQIDNYGNYNINAAVDLIYNPFHNDFLMANYTQTFDNDHPVQSDFYNYGKLFINWENRSTVGLFYQFLFSRAGENFNPEMGFELLENYTRGFASLGYGWVYNQEDKKMLSQIINIWNWTNKRNEDLKTNVASTAIFYEMAMKSGYRASAGILNNVEYLDETLDISDDLIFPVGDYNYNTLEASFSTPLNKLFSLRTMMSLGTYYDGKRITLGPAEVTYRPSAVVKLAINYQYNQVDVPERAQYFKAHLARLKTELTFTTELSLLMFFQYSSKDNFGINNIRFRYNPKEGNDLYLVYNGGYNTHLDREIPNLLRTETNFWILKYTYTFIREKK